MLDCDTLPRADLLFAGYRQLAATRGHVSVSCQASVPCSPACAGGARPPGSAGRPGAARTRGDRGAGAARGRGAAPGCGRGGGGGSQAPGASAKGGCEDAEVQTTVPCALAICSSTCSRQRTPLTALQVNGQGSCVDAAKPDIGRIIDRVWHAHVGMARLCSWHMSVQGRGEEAGSGGGGGEGEGARGPGGRAAASGGGGAPQTGRRAGPWPAVTALSCTLTVHLPLGHLLAFWSSDFSGGSYTLCMRASAGKMFGDVWRCD